jgi:hypothetical protein
MFYRVHLAMSGFQTHLSGALIAQVVGNPTTMRSRPRQPHNCIWKAIHNLKDDYNFLYFKLEWDLKFKLYLHDIELFDTQMYICCTTKVSLKPAHGEVYSIEHYHLCDKVYQWLETVWWFPPPIKLTATI